jgi:hypothetical protein
MTEYDSGCFNVLRRTDWKVQDVVKLKKIWRVHFYFM